MIAPFQSAGSSPSSTAGPLRLTSRGLFEAVADTIPALLFVYLFLLWPLAFGDSSVSTAKAALGWMASSASKEESPLKLVAYPFLFGTGLVCFLGSGAYRRVSWLSSGILLTLAFIALAAMSTVWSLFPSLTLQRAIVLFLTTSIVLFAAFSAGSFKTMLGRMFWVMFAVALVNVSAVILKDPTSIGHPGIYPHKNVFGHVAFLILVFGLYWLMTGRLLERLAAIFMIASSLVFLVVAQSKTSVGLALLSPMVGLGLFLLARYCRWSPAIVFSCIVILFLGFYWAGIEAGLWTVFSFNDAIFGNPTLTGRTDIWAFAADRIAERPLFGYGYEAVWSTGPDGLANRGAVGFTRITPTGHNGLVDLLLYTGPVGVLLALALFFTLLSEGGRLSAKIGGAGWLVLSIAVFCILHNLLESDFLVSSNPLSMIMLLLLFCATRANNDGRVRMEPPHQRQSLGV